MRQKNIRIFFTLLLGIISWFILPHDTYTQTLGIPIEYFSLIQQKIISHSIYPSEAKLKGWEGIVKVRFTLVRDGRIKEIDIAESSGYPLFDAATILAVRDASPYPFPADYPQEELEIIIPVSYEREYTALPQSPKPLPVSIPPVKEKAPEHTSPAPFEAPKPEPKAPSPQELIYFMDLALKNNQPTKVAYEDIKLAQFKVLEAQRNLLPSLKISGYNTEGEVYKVDYEEWEGRIEATQPLFYGGKLIDTVRQAKVNLEITQKNYDRLKLDVIHKTETAYHNLVASKMHLQLKETLLQEAKEILEKTERLYAMGMAIPLEVNSARSWFQQIQFQIDSIKQELFMAELTFKQVINTQETPQIEAQLLEAKQINIDLPTCIEAALQERPELYLSQLLVKFNDYGQRIKASESNAFSVDLTTSYGYYQGHYKTEPWTDSTNWFAGIKVTKPWGGSTFNSSYNTEETQPRFGQTSPTSSSTLSAEFNLLDNIGSLSEKKKSDIDMHRSLSDYNETLKTITFEVQDAFLNYQKAMLQLNTAQIEMEFRRNNLEVTKIRSMVGEASLSSLMEVLYNLSEAQTKYIQALTNYQISLANLKKTTGYGIKI